VKPPCIAAPVRRPCPRHRRRVLLVGCLAALQMTLAVSPARGQSARGVAPFLAADHWSTDAARRLHALGLTPRDFDPGLRSRSAAEWLDILDTAQSRVMPRHAASALVGAYRERFAQEYTGARRAASREPASLTRVALSGGYVRADGRVLGGVGFLDGDWTGARALPDERHGEARIELEGSSRGRTAMGANVAWRSGGLDVEQAYAAVALRNIGVWGGRRSPGYGSGAGGALVLSGHVPFTGIGAQLNRGYTLPGFLRVLGPVRFEGFLARVDNVHKQSGEADEQFRPYFGAARISGSPVHPRFTLSASRGAMFGGEGNAPLTLRNLITMLYGDHAGDSGEFHHEVFAVDATYRPPLGSVPLLLRLEWAMDDAAGMLHRAPGYTWAAELGAVPGMPLASFGFERTLFSGCLGCRNTLWYRNWYFREGWTDGGRLLGHPLGGHGREHRFYGSVEVPAARLGIDVELRSRERRSENLFVPQRAGGSVLYGSRLHWRGEERSFIDIGIAYERGENDWRATRIDARIGYRF
jgi:hypothetical protein